VCLPLAHTQSHVLNTSPCTPLWFSHAADCILQMEAACSCKMSVNLYQSSVTSQNIASFIMIFSVTFKFNMACTCYWSQSTFAIQILTYKEHNTSKMLNLNFFSWMVCWEIQISSTREWIINFLYLCYKVHIISWVNEHVI
jgi:hypothetical protein